MRLESSRASATFGLTSGGRLASLVVDGHELLITADDDAFGWGAYPMVPYAGRVDHGRFTFDGTEHTLPIRMDPHAIHGTVWGRTWERIDDGAIGTDLGPEWPFEGRVVQRAELDDTRLRLTLEVHAESGPMPSMAGWHPWFRRRLLDGTEGSLAFEAASMYELDDMIPTGRLVSPPPPGPWDDCFRDLTAPPRLTWPGAVGLELTSSCDHWVVYDRPDHAICVEPQTQAPDAVNREPVVIAPGAPLVATFDLHWA